MKKNKLVYNAPQAYAGPVLASEQLLTGSIQETGSAGDIYSTDGNWTY